MHVALVGLGYWGQKLLRNLDAVMMRSEIVAVDHDLELIERTAQAYPGMRVAFDIGEVLEDSRVQAVIIATPARLHGRLALLALEAGRHVLVEKPMATSLDEAAAMLEVAQRRSRVLMVGHTFLFSPRVRMLHDIITSGHLGAIHHISSRRLNLGTIRNDANVIWDLAPHDFSILLHLLGERPCLVQTAARSTLAHSPEVAFINLTFPSEVVASVAVSWLSPRKVRDVTVVGEARMAVLDDTAADEPIRVFDRGVVVPEGAGFGEHQLTYRYGDVVAPFVPATEPLWIQLQEFVAAIHGNVHTSHGAFGLDVVEVLEAADESWQRGGVAVSLGDATRIAV